MIEAAVFLREEATLLRSEQSIWRWTGGRGGRTRGRAEVAARQAIDGRILYDYVYVCRGSMDGRRPARYPAQHHAQALSPIKLTLQAGTGPWMVAASAVSGCGRDVVVRR